MKTREAKTMIVPMRKEHVLLLTAALLVGCGSGGGSSSGGSTGPAKTDPDNCRILGLRAHCHFRSSPGHPAHEQQGLVPVPFVTPL